MDFRRSDLLICLATGMNKLRVASLLNGKEGTQVRLRLLRRSATNSSQFVDVVLERRTFEVS